MVCLLTKECVICMQGQTRLSPLSPQETHISIAVHTHTRWHTWHDQTQADRDLDKIGKISLTHSHLKPCVITDKRAYQDIRLLASATDLDMMFKTWCYIFYSSHTQNVLIFSILKYTTILFFVSSIKHFKYISNIQKAKCHYNSTSAARRNLKCAFKNRTIVLSFFIWAIRNKLWGVADPSIDSVTGVQLEQRGSCWFLSGPVGHLNFLMQVLPCNRSATSSTEFAPTTPKAQFWATGL